MTDYPDYEKRPGRPLPDEDEMEDIYEDEESPLSQNEIDSIPSRTMDCMDCHNRPSHNYLSPSKFFDNAMTARKISNKIPEFKMVAMDLLHKEYPTKDTALMNIKNEILNYYTDSYPEFMDTAGALIDEAIIALQTEFQKNILIRYSKL